MKVCLKSDLSYNCSYLKYISRKFMYLYIFIQYEGLLLLLINSISRISITFLLDMPHCLIYMKINDFDQYSYFDKTRLNTI